MTRLRWRAGALAVSVVLPAALLGLTPVAGHACCDDNGDEDVVVTVNGTICWEQPPADGGDPRRLDKARGPAATVSLSKLVKEPVTVVFRTVDGTAVAPDDYEAITDLKVTIPAGERSVEVPLQIRADEKREPDEWFLVTIADPSTGEIGTGKAEVIIKDGAPPKGTGG